MSGAQKTIKVFAIAFAIFLLVNIFGVFFFFLSFVTDLRLGGEDSVQNFEEVYQNVASLDIDVAFSDITIKSASFFKVEASNVESSFSSKLSNGTLKIKESKKWFFSSVGKGEVTIYIPSDVQLKDLKINNGAGKITIEDVVASKLDIDQGTGTLSITNSKFFSTDIDGGVGEVKISASLLNNLKLDAGVGKISIESEITGQSEIECGVGEMDITLIGELVDYTITAEKGLGSMRINGEEKDADTVYGSGINELKIEGGVGSITVSFLPKMAVDVIVD